MGGTFIRLVDQGHEVHVAYQTSGNIAVFDDDAIRFAQVAAALSVTCAGAQPSIPSLRDVQGFATP